jgi:integrase
MTDTSLPLRSNRYAQLKSAAIDAFVAGRTPSQRELAEIISGQTGLKAEDVARQLTPYLRRLEQRGHYVPQRAPMGSKGSGMVAGELTSPWSFNWSTISEAEATLRHAAECYLAAGNDAVTESARHALRSAIRAAEGLRVRCSDAELLRACERTSSDRIHGYAERSYERMTATPSSIAEKTAKNHRAAIRAAIRHAAEKDAIPMVFPAHWPDSWEEWKDRYWPLAHEGDTQSTVTARRGGWTALTGACRTLFGDETRPEELTAEQAEAAIRHLQRVEGRIAAGYNAGTALRELGERFEMGPYVRQVTTGTDAEDEVFTEQTPAGLRPRLYLYDLDGSAADGDWDALLGMLERRGLPKDLVEFLRWYKEWITLDSLSILRSPAKYPPRRESMQLDDSTLEGRIAALRAFIGAAIKLCHLAPESLTPAALLGEQFGLILGEMTDWWERRRTGLAEGAKGSGRAGAIRQYVIAMGQFALAYYERLRHARGQRMHVASTTNAETRERRERLDWRQEESAAKNATEAMVWDAYRMAGQYADAMAGTVRGEKGKRAQRPNEFKNLERIIRNTPPTFWIALLDALIAEVRAGKRAGRDHGWRYHLLVLDTITLGLYISTGCRNSELLHVRFDVQFTEESRLLRRIELRARDRKNRKAHTVMLQPAFVPGDILEEYLTRTRDYFMRELHLERERPDAVKAHPFLLVNAEGNAYGCVEEQKDGTGRNKKGFRRRARQHSQRFKTHMAKAAVRHGLPLPTEKYEFGLHPLRGACGYAVYHQLGLVAAADYLGDTLDTVEDAYSAKSGLLVDSSVLRGLDMRPKLTLTATKPGKGEGRDNDVVRRLRVLLRDFEGRPDQVGLDDALRKLLGDNAA